MRSRRHLVSFIRLCTLCALAAAAGLVACANPRSEAAVAQALSDAAAEINGVKNDLAMMQTQLDSLRTVVIKQDSTISRIAAVNNIPISR
jgi:septal ring factor EnvC (AmiA/AmiB activator)